MAPASGSMLTKREGGIKSDFEGEAAARYEEVNGGTYGDKPPKIAVPQSLKTPLVRGSRTGKIGQNLPLPAAQRRATVPPI